MDQSGVNLIKELTNSSMTLPSYNLELVEKVKDQVLKHQETLNEILSEQDPRSPEISSALLFYHFSMQRNKRYLCVYHNERIKKLKKLCWVNGAVLPENFSPRCSDNEKTFYNEYSTILARFICDLSIDLTTFNDLPSNVSTPSIEELLRRHEQMLFPQVPVSTTNEFTKQLEMQVGTDVGNEKEIEMEKEKEKENKERFVHKEQDFKNENNQEVQRPQKKEQSTQSNPEIDKENGTQIQIERGKEKEINNKQQTLTKQQQSTELQQKTLISTQKETRESMELETKMETETGAQTENLSEIKTVKNDNSKENDESNHQLKNQNTETLKENQQEQQEQIIKTKEGTNKQAKNDGIGEESKIIITSESTITANENISKPSLTQRNSIGNKIQLTQQLNQPEIETKKIEIQQNEIQTQTQTENNIKSNLQQNDHKEGSVILQPPNNNQIHQQINKPENIPINEPVQNLIATNNLDNSSVIHGESSNHTEPQNTMEIENISTEQPTLDNSEQN
ncbi:partner of sld5 [Anaeramoeba flamelloides]|uniref:Partner of sld5 n=1 Tax=Anaeramoeba flamelloides TaxID=1746091 RepID=A0AAV7YDV9_9EUKA|nr:partner of sld5 [Anaeramoeba flamelloides]